MSRYKAGQLITIKHHIYRVRKGFCVDCGLFIKGCAEAFPNCLVKIGLNSYLELVK